MDCDDRMFPPNDDQMFTEQEIEFEGYQRENEELREVLRRCGELAKSRKTGAIQHLVKKTLGVEHFERT